jgi:hypothetical protein
VIDSGYLQKGLCALARAHRVSLMSGHLGAAIVAGCFIAEQHPDLDARVYEGIQGELDRIIRGESVFSPDRSAAMSTARMFAPFPNEQQPGASIDGIADALADNIDQTRESGHNVIFAAIAIRALKAHPELATPSVTGGIRKLIAGFDDTSPGSGYYGRQKGRVDGRLIRPPEDDTFPPYPDLHAMANTVLDELIQRASQPRVGFGGLWHVINHAAALAELVRQGYRELAHKGLAAHRQHLRLFRSLPDVTAEFGAETPTVHDPRTPEFWELNTIRRERAHLTHRIKTLYAFHILLELVEDDARRDQGLDRLLYLM